MASSTASRALATVLALPVLLSACVFYVSPRRDGATLFKTSGCTDCHGPDGAGGPNGPALRGLAERWNEGTLTRFLEDPDARLAEDPRLEGLARTFRNRMPPFDRLPRSHRRELARHLLAR